MSDLFGSTAIIMASALLSAVCGVASAFILNEPHCETKVVTRENMSIPRASREMLRHRTCKGWLAIRMLRLGEWAFALMGVSFLAGAAWLALRTWHPLAHATIPYQQNEVKNE